MMDWGVFLLVLFWSNYGIYCEPFNDELYALSKSPLKCKFDTKDDYYDVDELKIYRFDYKANATDIYGPDEAQDLVENKHFSTNDPIELFIHGFIDDVDSPFTKVLREAYEKKAVVPFYVLDCSAYLHIKDNIVTSYFRSVELSYHIGNKLAEFLYDLVLSGVPVSTIHLIGHSIGAHIAGYAARRFEEMAGEKLTRITGLDPAGPCFTDASLVEQIKAEDAEFVDLYHCNRGELGTSNSLGTADFFPNGDQVQEPDCQEISPELSLTVRSSVCSHYACVTIFAETVKQERAFLSEKCNSFAEFKRAVCTETRSVAGFAASPESRGKYFFTTRYLSNSRNFNLLTKIVQAITVL